MKLSICCITYNHGIYLEEAIKSFVSQKTSFDFEIVIADDHSTDGTFDLVNEYCKKYPSIKYHRHSKNIGMMPNCVFSLQQCTGEYIALCEGDDYWVDSHKLQKQVDFLEANKDYSICFTGAMLKNVSNNTESISIPQPITSIEDLIKHNGFCTSTTVFASQYFKPVPNWLYDMPYGDWPLFLTVLYLSKKKAYCLQEVTSVYRMHTGGVYRSMYTSNSKIIKTVEWAIDAYKKIQTYLFKDDYKSIIETCIRGKESMIADLLDERKSHSSVLGEIMSLVPINGSFILVDDWSLEVEGEVDGRKVLPFTEHNGAYWGQPADDAAAIAEIDRQRRKGVNVIIFVWREFWWLEHYSGMHDYLRSTYKCIIQNERLIGFDLQKRISIEHSADAVAENININ